MNLKCLNNKNIKKCSLLILAGAAIIISALYLFMNIHAFGKKDSLLIFASITALVYEIYIMFYDRKKSIFLFIITFPIIVAARRAVYFDFAIFKITLETIYITILFIYSFKDVMHYVSNSYKKCPDRFTFFLMAMAFIILSMNSSIYSSSTVRRSMGYVYISVTAPVLFYLSTAAIFKREDYKKIVYSLILMVDLSSLYGICQIILSGISIRGTSPKRILLTFGFNNVNIFAGILILVMPFMLDMLLYREKDNKNRLFLAFSILLNLFSLYITFTRGAWIAFILSVPVLLISKKYKKLLYAAGALLLVAIKPVAEFIATRGTGTGLLSNESTIARLESFFISAKIIRTYPFGGGAGNFAALYKRFALPGYLTMPIDIREKIVTANYNLEAAHNLWMQIGTELGIVTMILFLVIIIYMAVIAIKNFRENRPEISAIIAYVVFSILTGVEFEHKGIITATLIIWLIFMLIEFPGKEKLKDEKAC
jgi:O-antigen ligase